MPDDPSANVPLPLAETLAAELASFGFTPPKISPTPDDDARLREVYRAIREAQPERSALCFSGGGIRSATFGLGVTQALAAAGLLKQFDYLSTVSGGGYLGSLLSARIHHHPDGLAGVEQELKGAGPTELMKPEPAPLAHLRRFSNYIAPKVGLLSADGWMLVATALRNLLLNWTVLVSVIAAALVLPWLGLLAVFGQPTPFECRILLGIAFFGVATATAYPGFDLPTFNFVRLPESKFLLGWLTPMLAGIFAMLAWWAGKTNSDPHILKWMQGPDGLRWVAVFLSAASLAGVVACVVCVWFRDIRRGRQTLVGKGLVRAGVCALFSLLVIGIPAALLLRAVAAWVFPLPSESAQLYMTFAPVLLLGGFFMMNCLYIGFTSRWTDDDDREWWARAAGWLGGVSVAWLCVQAMVFWVPTYTPMLSKSLQAAIAASGGIAGFISAKIASSEKTSAILKSNPELKRTAVLVSAAFLFFAVLSCIIAKALLSIFVATVPLAYLGPLEEWQRLPMFDRLSTIVAYPELFHPLAMRLGLVLAGLVGVAVVMGYFININRFSLHATYRSRLVRAYLGAARAGGFSIFSVGDFPDPSAFLTKLKTDSDSLSQFLWGRLIEHRPDWNTANSSDDEQRRVLVESMNKVIRGGPLYDERRFACVELSPETRALKGLEPKGEQLIRLNRLLLEDAYPGELRRNRAAQRRPHPFTGFDPEDNIPMHKLAHPRPLHVVNMTLNLIGGRELAWQERKADSFTATRLHAGNHRLGYRPVREYAEGLRLGTALAISGAAASPNQGYHSSPILTFLMTLFNVRLGWWLGNPGAAGHLTWTHNGPLQATLPLFVEALGLTNERRGYVYLSDGGHFENLAIYEMLLRRCRWIVVVDAEQDGEYAFEGLGGAVRKARIDMGIPIEFRGLDRISKKLPSTEQRCFAIGRIDYKARDGCSAEYGYLLYLKPLLTGCEPTDVSNYATMHGDFPQESTADQFFSESQFESYRALGMHVADAFLHTMPTPPRSLGDVFAHAEKLWQSLERRPGAVPCRPTS